MNQAMLWDKENSLRMIEVLPKTVPIGTYHRFATGQWRRRVKRRVAGHTWKMLKLKNVPKRIFMEALLLGIPL